MSIKRRPALVTNKREIGYSYSTIAWIPETTGSWALPLRHERIIPILATLTTDSVEYNLSRVEGKIWQEFIT